MESTTKHIHEAINAEDLAILRAGAGVVTREFRYEVSHRGPLGGEPGKPRRCVARNPQTVLTVAQQIVRKVVALRAQDHIEVSVILTSGRIYHVISLRDSGDGRWDIAFNPAYGGEKKVQVLAHVLTQLASAPLAWSFDPDHKRFQDLRKLAADVRSDAEQQTGDDAITATMSVRTLGRKAHNGDCLVHAVWPTPKPIARVPYGLVSDRKGNLVMRQVRCTLRLEPCNCGCTGSDPWHQPWYARTLVDVEHDPGKCETAIGPNTNYDWTGYAKFPWGSRPTRVVRVIARSTLKEGEWASAGWMIDLGDRGEVMNEQYHAEKKAYEEKMAAKRDAERKAMDEANVVGAGVGDSKGPRPGTKAPKGQRDLVFKDMRYVKTGERQYDVLLDTDKGQVLIGKVVGEEVYRTRWVKKAFGRTGGMKGRTEIDWKAFGTDGERVLTGIGDGRERRGAAQGLRTHYRATQRRQERERKPSWQCCAEPKVRGGRCDNCGTWIQDALVNGV
jgi:hypothetical protein